MPYADEYDGMRLIADAIRFLGICVMRAALIRGGYFVVDVHPAMKLSEMFNDKTRKD